ncbi:hypothetical protein DH2020_016801 [Rehmannia glutinosa]|uniref:Uncharacterized protein n=1 Tax=Rehmannia glutinosa TaxID=99300 RepID=A0ABR0WQQ3_REHGL
MVLPQPRLEPPLSLKLTHPKCHVDAQKVDIVKQRPGLLDEKSSIRSCGEGTMRRRDEGDHCISERKEMIEYREKPLLRRGGSSLQGGDDLLSRERHPLIKNKHSYPIEKGDAELKVESSSHGKLLDNKVHTGYIRPSNCIRDLRKGENTEALYCEKSEFAPSCLERPGRTEIVISYNNSNQDNAPNSIRKGPEDGSDRLRSGSSYALPPPYVKSKDNIPRPPYIKPKDDKHRHSRGSKHGGSDQGEQYSIGPGSCNRSNIVDTGSGRPNIGVDRGECEEQLVAPAKVKNYGHEKELEYQDDKIPLPKPRSIRRKHHKSSSSIYNNVVDALEDDGAVNRISSSRRKDHSRKGLQILFDEEHHRKDDEERVIDKLLIHYSKKPSRYDARSFKKKLPGQPSYQVITDHVGESSVDQSRDADDVKFGVFPAPSRSASLPHEQATTSPEVKKKVFTRANTFQPDNQARHVHPKLPDYDDLAARFAALKGR